MRRKPNEQVAVGGIEQLERRLVQLPELQILRIVLPKPGERIIGIEATPELELPALDRGTA